MRSYPALRRWVLAACVAAVFGFVFAVAGPPEPRRPLPGRRAAGRADADSWPLFGGTVSGNLVNLVDKNMPMKWSLRNGTEQNVKWSAPLGSKAYGGPIIAGGKIFVGTNNNRRATRTSGRQGHPDVLQRGRRQVPLAVHQRQAARRPRQRLARRGHLLQPRRRGRPPLVRHQPLRGHLPQHRRAWPPATRACRTRNTRARPTPT